MKLLLVEDEELTRIGVLNYIPWEAIGITDIQTAEDGQEGLLKALSCRPDIVMADVRMPHMDGITMAFEIRKQMDCCFIFMSGFCDKEYLKSAIVLSAVNYIEKPVEPGEIIQTVKKAVKQVQEEKRRRFLEKEYEGRHLGIEQEMEQREGLCWESGSILADKVEQYIREHCQCNNLSLTVLADRFHLTKQYLCLIFKREKGTTINQYIIDCRVVWAKEYLNAHKGHRIKDVALLSGFTDSNYFIKCFKKHYGSTPMDYKNSHKEVRGDYEAKI